MRIKKNKKNMRRDKNLATAVAVISVVIGLLIGIAIIGAICGGVGYLLGFGFWVSAGVGSLAYLLIRLLFTRS